jgi:hypothetical protein
MTDTKDRAEQRCRATADREVLDLGKNPRPTGWGDQ